MPKQSSKQSPKKPSQVGRVVHTAHTVFVQQGDGPKAVMQFQLRTNPNTGDVSCGPPRILCESWAKKQQAAGQFEWLVRHQRSVAMWEKLMDLQPAHLTLDDPDFRAFAVSGLIGLFEVHGMYGWEDHHIEGPLRDYRRGTTR